MIWRRRWEHYCVSAHIFCGSLELYSCCTQCEQHWYWPATGIWPVWRDLTEYYLLAFLIPFITTSIQKPRQFSSWKVCVERQLQYEFPCIPTHSCLQICTSTADFAEKEHHHQTGLVNFIWKDNDALQTPRDTFSSTSWGFSYMSPININGTQAAKSTCIALKMYPWGPNSQQQKQHKPFYPQDICFRDPWREQNTLCGSLNLFTVHKWTDAAG